MRRPSSINLSKRSTSDRDVFFTIKRVDQSDRIGQSLLNGTTSVAGRRPLMRMCRFSDLLARSAMLQSVSYSSIWLSMRRADRRLC